MELKALKVIIHNHIEALEEIMPEWEQLTKGYFEITIFQHIDWMKNWWELKKKSKDITPYIMEIKDENNTVGIIPLYLSDKTFTNINFRILRPIGVAHSDYLIPILSKQYKPESLFNAMKKQLDRDKLYWDCIHWGDVPKGSILDMYLKKELKEQKNIVRKKTYYSPRVTLNKDMDLVTDKISKKFLKGIRYYERKLKREGDLVYHRVKNEWEIEPIMDKHFEFHYDRWKNTETPSIYFKSKEEKEWLMNTIKSLFHKELLHLSYLTHNGEVAAIELGMADHRTRYLFMGTMNPKFLKYPIGHIIVYKLLEEACEKGYEVMDFLTGEEEYKQKWGPTNKDKIEYLLFNNSSKSALFRLINNTYYSKQFQEENIIKQTLFKLWIRGRVILLGFT